MDLKNGNSDFSDIPNTGTPNVSNAISNSTEYHLSSFELGLRISIGLGLCSIAAFLHTLIAISIYRGKHMENRFYVFMFFITIARIMFALGYVIASIYHVLRTSGTASLTMSSLGCHAIRMFALFPPTLEVILLLILVIDRAVAFQAPMKYRNLTSKQAVKICVAACICWFLFNFLASYEGVSATKIISCATVLSPLTPNFARFYQYFDFSLSVAILVPFLYIICLIRWRVNRGGSLVDASVKRSMKVLLFLRLQLLMHCLFVVSSRSMKLAAAFVESTATEQRLATYYGMLAAIDIFVNAVIFFWKYPKIWHESVRLVCGERMTRKFVQWKVLKKTQTDSNSVAVPASKVAPAQPIDSGPDQE